MDKKSAQYVNDIIDSEGFDYGLRSYSNFEKVKDEEFHRLLKAYRVAADALEEYIDKQ
jgi:hypothetical protein